MLQDVINSGGNGVKGIQSLSVLFLRAARETPLFQNKMFNYKRVTLAGDSSQPQVPICDVEVITKIPKCKPEIQSGVVASK